MNPMKAKISIRSLSAALISLSMAMGAAHAGSKPSSPDYDRVYRATNDLCRVYRDGGFLEVNQRSVAEAIRLADASAGEAFWELRYLFVSRSLEEVFESPAYHDALWDCYGDDELSKNLFFFSAIAADAAGKYLAAAGHGAAYRMASHFLPKAKAAYPLAFPVASSFLTGASTGSLAAQLYTAYIEARAQMGFILDVGNGSANTDVQQLARIDDQEIHGLLALVHAKTQELLLRLEAARTCEEREDILARLRKAEEIGVKHMAKLRD